MVAEIAKLEALHAQLDPRPDCLCQREDPFEKRSLPSAVTYCRTVRAIRDSTKVSYVIIIVNEVSGERRMRAVSNLEPQEALVAKFFERRNVQLFEGVRHERAVSANRMAAAGTR